VSTPEITPTATIAISTPFLRYSTLRRIRNRLIPVLFPLVPKNHLKHRKISDIRRESHYPAYPLVAMSSTLELEKVQQTLKENLGKIQSPVLLIQSHKDLSEESIAQITSKLVRTKYESIWHDNFNHSMVLDKNRKLVFEEIDHYIQKITNERGPR
jgi:carboxylesterase